MCLIFKAPDRECYAVMVKEILYIPVISIVFESGTSLPMKVANRVVTNGIHGFWTPHSGILDWRLVDTESIPKEWMAAITSLIKAKSPCSPLHSPPTDGEPT